VDRRLPVGLPDTWIRVYAGIWMQTLGFTAIVALGGAALRDPARQLLELKLSAHTNPPPSVGRVFDLLAHNLPAVAWPLLLGMAGAHRHRPARWLADVLLLACITINTLLVGAAVGAYGTRVLAYIPQLPFEWAALALAATSWLAHRRTPLTVQERVGCLALIAFLLTCAAVLETAGVPHR